jgi:hypothetical protein
MLHVRHRSASGRLDALWEFDPGRSCVEVVLRRGGAMLALTIPVCAIDKPRCGAFPIMRLDSSSWRIMPIRYMWASASGTRLVHRDECIHESLSIGDAIILAQAPEDVDLELSELSL